MLGGHLLLHDVFIEILLHLPVRSLVRFRSVTKSLCALIKSPSFVNIHFLKSRTNDTVLLVRSCSSELENGDVFSFHDHNSSELEQVGSSISIPFLKDLKFRYNASYMPPCVHILGPYNGIVCICYSGNIIFCNPALKEFKPLPPCPFACPKGYMDEIMAEGFGRTCTNDLKVIMIRSITPISRHEIGTYTISHSYNSSTNSWKNYDGDALPVQGVRHYPLSEIFFNGFCHWHASFTLYGLSKVMLTFDINIEVFRLVEYPDYSEELRRNFLCFIALNNCLSMVWYEGPKTEPQLIDIWVMKEYGQSESWTKTFVIGPYQLTRCLMPWNNDEWLLIETSEGQLATCSLHTNEIKRFQIYGAERTLRTLLYKESLISLN